MPLIFFIFQNTPSCTRSSSETPQRVRYHYRTHPIQHMLTPFLLSSVLAYSYVACIKYAQPKSLQGLSRNDILVIKYRLRRVTCLCLGVLLILPIIVTHVWHYYPSIGSCIRQLGLIPGFTNAYSAPEDIQNILLCVAKMALLYCGPITVYLLDGPQIGEDIVDLFCSIHGFRDHVFAPVTEEFIYRAAIVCLLKPMGVSVWKLTAYTPVLFGLAHFHHSWDLYKTGEALPTVLVSALFQFLYTSLFGMLANYIYLASHENLWCPIVMHSVCNLGGFPSFDVKETHPRLFVPYCFILVVGLCAFYKLI